MFKKKKLLIVAGAGSAIEFGMPSTDDIHKLFLKLASQYFPLRNEPDKNLYGYLYDEIERHWAIHNRVDLRKKPNFEDVLYAIYTLAGIYPAGIFTSALGAFVGLKNFPEAGHQGLSNEPVLRNIGQQLVDILLDDMRKRCIADIPHFEKFKNFFSTLSKEFDIAVVTTNYDDLVYRVFPDIETGFDLDNGAMFKQERIFDRKFWPCLFHLHGSVHFDMDIGNYAMDEIYWRNDFRECHPNSFGRSTNRTPEGNEFPSSCIIAGYGKPIQIQRRPFRTYYSELDHLVDSSDATLFLGYGFSDRHLNQAFAEYRNVRNRPVVVIDYADDTKCTARGTNEYERTTVRRAMHLFRNKSGQMSWAEHDSPLNVAPIKLAKDFERCTDKGCRLSLWYNGMLEACNSASKILIELVKN